VSRFILYRPTPEDVAAAFGRSKRLGIPPSSMTRGAGRMVGFLGEIAFERTFPEASFVGDKSFTHDYEYNGLNIDVKSKVCASPPLMHFNATVFSRHGGADLPADIYFFTRVTKDFSKVWLVGWATGKTVQKPRFFKKKGESDKTGFTFMGDGYHLPISKTRRPDSFRDLCRKQRQG
jgi:hypothetical protein